MRKSYCGEEALEGARRRARAIVRWCRAAFDGDRHYNVRDVIDYL